MPGRMSTRGTVLIAGAANVFVGAIKLAAGIMVGSSAMLAEAAHSAADTLNQAFLLASIHRGERPADPRHPFGYGQERYFWSLLAAFGIFIAGAGFSVFEGLLALRHGSSVKPFVAYAALAAAGLAEGASLSGCSSSSVAKPAVATWPSSNMYAAVPIPRSRRRCSRTARRSWVSRLPGPGWACGSSPDHRCGIGAASIAIGGLLIAVAIRLGLDSRDFLIGRSADPRDLEMIRAEIENAQGIDALLDLRTMHLGPDRLIVAAQVAFSDEISADRAEDVADGIDRRLAERLRLAPHVFLDPTQAPTGSQPAARVDPAIPKR